MEARGEIRGGRFVAGTTGEQFALPEAIAELRSLHKQEPDGRFVRLSACDPLNLVGILTPGARVPAIIGNRIVFCGGSPIAAVESGETRMISQVAPSSRPALDRLLDPRPASAFGPYNRESDTSL